MGKRKTFHPGQEVEIQREVGSAWESAIYRVVVPVWPDPAQSRHHVELPRSATTRVVVHSRRIRAKENK